MGPYASEGFLGGGKGGKRVHIFRGLCSCCVDAAGWAFGGA